MANQTPDTLTGQWQSVYGELTKALGDRLALRWLSKIVPDTIENNEVNLFVPSPCIHELVKQNYADQILSIWQAYNPAIDKLNFKLKPAFTTPSTSITEETNSFLGDSFLKQNDSFPIKNSSFHTSLPTELELDGETIPCFLDPSHTFDTFVVGKSNEFAYAAARRVAEDESILFNPLYLHSSVGLGKTHLMHAIAWKIKELYPEKSVVYLSSEQFFQHFIRALRSNKTESFRDLFRSVDVLMIDDVQFIFGKKATQEEFFHTFNALIARGKKIILSADSSPMDLQGIEDRLKTRIAQGLVVNIQKASYELRLGILQEKRKQTSVHIPDDVLDFLAKRITASVRELEGALKRLIAHVELIGGIITLHTAKEVLKDMLQTTEKQITIPMIQHMVADYYQIALQDLKSTRRDRHIARPRQMAMYLSKILTSLSLPDIASYFGRDHTTIIHAIKTIEGLCLDDPKLVQDKETIINRLKAGEDEY